MATVIQNGQIPNSIKELPQLGNTGGGASFNFKEVQGFIGGVTDLLKTMAQIRKEFNPEVKQMPQGTPYQPSHKGEGQEVKIQKEVIMMELDEEKVKAMVRDLIVNQMAKFPEDIKVRPVKDFIGEEFLKFKYKVKKMGMNIELNHESLIELISKNLIQGVKNCQKEKGKDSGKKEE